MVVLFLVAWEGLERGWWARLLHPLLGASAERWQLKPIFISSPTLVAQAAFRMFFVTGEIWRDLGWSALGYGIGLTLEECGDEVDCQARYGGELQRVFEAFGRI